MIKLYSFFCRNNLISRLDALTLSVSEFEKDKSVRELEMQELARRLENNLNLKESELIKTLEKESELSQKLDALECEKEEYRTKLHQMQQGMFIIFY